jgi:hypothetical protein
MPIIDEPPAVTGIAPGLAPENSTHLPLENASGLQPFAQNIWIVDGPLVLDMGILFPTRMTVVRLQNGSLWISSPVSVPFKNPQCHHIFGAGKIFSGCHAKAHLAPGILA